MTVITEDIVERAARVLFEQPGIIPGEGYSWEEMVREDPSRADIWREDARAILVAALSENDTDWEYGLGNALTPGVGTVHPEDQARWLARELEPLPYFTPQLIRRRKDCGARSGPLCAACTKVASTLGHTADERLSMLGAPPLDVTSGTARQ